MSRASIAATIADKVRDEEFCQSHALGHFGFDVFLRGWAVWSETYLRMFEADRPAVLTRFRTYRP